MSIGSIIVQLNRLNKQLKTTSALKRMNHAAQGPDMSALENIPERDIAGDNCRGKQCRNPCNVYQLEGMERLACKKGLTCCCAATSVNTCCTCTSLQDKQWLRKNSHKACYQRRMCLCKDAKLKEHKGPETQSRGSSADRVNVKSMESSTDNLDIDKLQQDLENEKKLKAELAEQLENLTCSMKCLKSDGEQQAACLRDALAKSEEQVKLAVRSRNLAMDLAKQSRDHSDMIKTSKNDLAAEIAILKQQNIKLAEEAEKNSTLSKQLGQTICDNTKLACECKELKFKLKNMTENEAKKCAEVSEEVNKIKSAVHKKEEALNTEKNEYEEMITELTNVVKIQKKQICELSGVCNQQQILLQKKDTCISEKDTQLCDQQCKFKTMVSKVKDLKVELENLKCSFAEETQKCNTLRKEVCDMKDDHHCELRIKEKMIEDQSDTIRKLKKLLQESEKMAKHAAREFEQLTDQLFCEKETNTSLQAALEVAESKLPDQTSMICSSCEELESRLDCVEEQKRKALLAAKFAAEKFFESKKEFQKQLQCQKQQYQLLKIILQKREYEIECLKAKFQNRRQVAEKRSSCIN